MKIDFFLVEVPEDVVFADILSKVSHLRSNDVRRAQEVDGIPYRMHELRKAGHLWEGDMMRIRMNDIPVIASLDGKVEEVDLDDDEGIGEETSFLYDEQTHVLAFQRNRFGMTPQKFGRYFEVFEGLDEPIIPTMVLDPNVAVELARVRVVRKLQLRFAGIRNPKLVTEHGPNAIDAIKLLDGESPVVDITLAMGHERGSLPLRAAIESAKKFFRWAEGRGEAQVDTVKVIGTFDDDSPADIDLLAFRMVETHDVEPDRRSRRLLYGDRKAALRAAFNHRKGQLNNLFGG